MRAAVRVATGLLSFVLCSCRDTARPPTADEDAQRPGALDRYVRWLGEISLEENDTVINVIPFVKLDGRGGFLVSDQQENQIRAYRPDGKLVRHFGRSGSGPKEFTGLRGAVPMASGAVLALSDDGRGVVFDSMGGTALHTFTVPLFPIQHIRLVSDTLLLLGGKALPQRGRAREGRLHLWSVTHDTLVRSFFTPRIEGRAHTLAATVAGFVGSDTRNDTVAAVFMLTDTLFFFSLDGRKLGQLPIPFQHFRPLGEGGRLIDNNSTMVERREWLGTFSMVSDVFWLRDGGFLVQYQDRVGLTPHWRLLRMRRNGTRVFDVVGTPQLLAVDRRDDTLYFMKPGSLTANVWSRAKLAD
jgi:hypothetical protein